MSAGDLLNSEDFLVFDAFSDEIVSDQGLGFHPSVWGACPPLGSAPEGPRLRQGDVIGPPHGSFSPIPRDETSCEGASYGHPPICDGTMTPAARVRPITEAIRIEEITSYSVIAADLNRRGILTANGGYTAHRRLNKVFYLLSDSPHAGGTAATATRGAARDTTDNRKTGR